MIATVAAAVLRTPPSGAWLAPLAVSTPPWLMPSGQSVVSTASDRRARRFGPGRLVAELPRTAAPLVALVAVTVGRPVALSPGFAHGTPGREQAQESRPDHESLGPTR
jgi:hypothetical protein